MDLYKTFATDKNLETTGITLAYGDNSRGQPIEIDIARAGGANVKFSKVLEAKMRPYRRAVANGSLDEKVALKVLVETYAEAVVVNWRGVLDREGNELEFNRDNVVKVFLDLPDLFMDVQAQAQQAALFREAVLEEVQGNSIGS